MPDVYVSKAPSTQSGRLRQWLALAVVAAVLAVICVFLGMWQWGRHEARSERIAQINAAYNAPVTPLADLLFQGEDPITDEWRPVTATGTFIGEPVLVRNRPVGIGSGFHVLGVIALDSGGELVLNRGYLPTKLPADQVTIPQTPVGKVTVLGRVRPAEPDNSRGVTGNQVYTFSPEQVMQAAGLSAGGTHVIRQVYVVADTSDADTSSQLLAVPAPSTEIGSHLSYAFQWWTFAAGIIGVYLVFLMREFRPRRLTIDDLLVDSQSATPARAKRAERLDENAEDAAISAQLH